MKKQSGFTLIELVMVIVILGILAATALPRFYDLSTDARVAAVKGTAGSIASASAINYAASLTKTHTVVDTTTNPCTNAMANSLLDSSSQLPSTYTVSGAATSVSVGASVTCTLTDSNASSSPASFAIIGAK